MRIALVHDWLNNLGGAGRVLIELHNIFPEAPIYTLFSRKSFVEKHLPGANIKNSFIQKIPLITRNYLLFSWLMPAAIESFDFSEYDVVISSCAIFSKGIILNPKTKHICYCYSPSRQLWDNHTQYNKSWPERLAGHGLRIWDLQAARRVDQFVATSQHVVKRIKKYYGRESIVIYPPLSNLRIENSLKINQDYYLIVSRLYDYKNIDMTVEAFNKLDFPLVIIGEGPARKNLELRAKSNIVFLGELDDETVGNYYANCRAFIMPQEEDLGLTALEAMSFGKPVLALRKGGALETVIEGVTGEFFDDPIPEGLADGIRRLNENYKNYNPEIIKKSIEKFSVENFRKSILKIINS